MNLERIEELAARHVAGVLGTEERKELEDRLRASAEARGFFAEYCMDEVLLAGALRARPRQEETGSSEPPAPQDSVQRRAVPAGRRGALLRAASLMFAFLGGWAGANVARGARPADERTASRAPTAADPIPIHYQRANAAPARLVVHPLDFDESGALSTNPFLHYVPVEATEL